MTLAEPFKTKTIPAIAVIYAATAVVLTRIPLFNLLHYEFCLVITVVSALCSGLVSLRIYGLNEAESNPVRASWRPALLTNFVLLMIPLGVILINALFVDNCCLADGLQLYVLLPVISACFMAVIGLYLGFMFKRRRSALLGFLLIVVAWIVFDLIAKPPIFVYSHAFGYFPGPLYDEWIPIGRTLVMFRGLTVLISAFLLTVLVRVSDQGKVRKRDVLKKIASLFRFLKKPLPRRNIALTTFLSMAAVAIVGSYVYKETVGFDITYEHLKKKLRHHIETEHCDIYLPEGMVSTREARALALQTEYHFVEAARYLDLDPESRLSVHIYRSPWQKKRLMGAEDTKFAKVWNYEIHLNFDDYSSSLKHEIAHVLSTEFGLPFITTLRAGLLEGVAVAAEWDYPFFTPHQWSAAIMALDRLPDMERMIQGSTFYTQASSLSYILSGSFCRFLIDSFGIEKFKQVYPYGDFESVYHQDLTSLLAQWKTFIKDQVPVTEKQIQKAAFIVDRKGIFQKRCPHVVASYVHRGNQAFHKQDFRAALENYGIALSHDPEKSSLRLAAARSRFLLADYPGSMDDCASILEDSTTSYLLHKSTELVLADNLIAIGRTDSAEKVLETLIHADATRHLSTRAALRLELLSGPLQPSEVREILTTVDSLQADSLYGELLSRYPNEKSLLYLSGKKALSDRRYEKAAHFFSAALLDTTFRFPQTLFDLNVKLARTRFVTGLYQGSAETLGPLIANSADDAEKNRLQDWKNMIDWVLKAYVIP